MEDSADRSHQTTETCFKVLKTKEARGDEEKDGHPKENNLPPESDFYCKLCDVDCINNTGKLHHSLDASHVEAYLLSLKMTHKKKPSFKAEAEIESKLNQIASPSTTIKFEPGGQHSVYNTPISETIFGQEGKKHANSKPKNKGLDDPEFSLLHSQSSAPRSIFGSTTSETESSCRSTTSVQMKHFFSSSFAKHTYGFHPKDGENFEENNVGFDKLNDGTPCTSKDSQVIKPNKAVSLDSKMNTKVSDVDFIADKIKALHISHKMEDHIVCVVHETNEDIGSKFKEKPPDKDCCRRIILEGIAAGIDRKMVIRKFAKYGLIKSNTFIGASVHIEYLEWQSVERIFAEQAQKKIIIDGKEIQIKKNWRKPKKGLQIEKLPKCVKSALFSSEEKFLNQLDEFLARYQLSLLDMYKQQAVCDSVVSSLKNFAPKVYPYGSRITGLATKNSDLDIFVYITKPCKYFKDKYLRFTQELIIHDAAWDIMSSSDFSNVVKIPKASVPIVTCKHIPTGLNCDLTFRYPYQVYNTGLTLTYLSVDHRVRPLILLIRYWASALGLLGKGKFSSYSLNLMCIFYLQQIANKPILPSVSLLMKLARDHERASYGFWDCGYCEDILLIPKSVNDSSLFHHVKGFFKFFAEFDTNNMVVCPFLGKPVHKKFFRPGMEKQLPIEFEKYKSNCLERLTEPLNVDHVLCIQDPFVHNNNVARQNRKEIVEHFQICCYLYTHEHDNEDKFGSSLTLHNPVRQGNFSESKKK